MSKLKLVHIHTHTDGGKDYEVQYESGVLLCEIHDTNIGENPHLSDLSDDMDISQVREVLRLYDEMKKQEATH